MTVRLQKHLAERGIAARRAAAEWVRAGRVTVNGETVREPGLRIDPEADCVAVDGRIVPAQRTAPRTVLLHKPRGYVCSTRGQGARTVYALLDGVTERLVPAGRLDKDSEGLVVLTNDGDLVQRLTHPRHGHVKTYRVTVSGAVDAAVLRTLRAPLEIDGYTTRPAEVRVIPGTGRMTLEFTLREGRNQQVRRLCARAGLRVHRLVRTAFGPWTLKGLKPGDWRDAPSR
jgi:23S rRNA pseudouridine2605 synthase